MLWAKEGNYWKVISWDIEPEDAKPDAIPETRQRSAASHAPESLTKGDQDLLRSSDQFLHSWLVADDFATSARFFSPHSEECASVFLSAGEQEPQTPEQYAAFLRASLTTIGKDVGKVHNLRDAIEAVEPEHDDLKIVAHSRADAYTVVALPDYLATLFTCKKKAARLEQAAMADSQPENCGKYFATLFALRTPGDNPASLAFVWSKEDGQWMIISYSLMVR